MKIKSIYDQKIRPNSVYVKKVKLLYRFYDVKVKMVWNKIVDSSFAYPDRNYILLNPVKFDATYYYIDEFISEAMHELAHILNYRNDKYKIYHKSEAETVEEVEIQIRTAIKAEKYTDKVAAKLTKFFFPEIRFIKGYGTKKAIEHLKKETISDLYFDLLQKSLDEQN